jgi:hypothetical protein
MPLVKHFHLFPQTLGPSVSHATSQDLGSISNAERKAIRADLLLPSSLRMCSARGRRQLR